MFERLGSSIISSKSIITPTMISDTIAMLKNNDTKLNITKGSDKDVQDR